MQSYEPPFTQTARTSMLLGEACELLGHLSATNRDAVSVHLRRENRIRTIHSSLAIEANTLTLEQVTDILDGKRVLGSPVEIAEVKNARDAYELLLQVNPLSIDDLLRAHGAMMHGLVDEAGRFRTGGVGVFDGDALIHMAPPAEFVPQHVANLMSWYGTSELHPLVKSCVFHYEFEFIHPFQDGNGRMGRMWHTALLGAWNPFFYWLPVEELIQRNQAGYYDALGKAGHDANSGPFVEFMMELFKLALSEFAESQDGTDQVSDQVTDQVRRLVLSIAPSEAVAASLLMTRLGLSHRPTFRANYLQPALELGLIEMTIPDKPQSRNQKYRLTARGAKLGERLKAEGAD